jgi:hypothetical protein
MDKKLKVKILNSGRIPGYPINGPVLHPIEITKEQAMRFITAGLDLRVWVDQLKAYVKFSPRDMVDFYNDKNYIGKDADESHAYYGEEDCGVQEPPVDINTLIERTRIKQTGNSVNYSVKPKFFGNEPTVYVIEENEREENVFDDEPDFGDAYEPTPFEAFGLDDFEEK